MENHLTILEVWIGEGYYEKVETMAEESGETVEDFLITGLFEWLRSVLPDDRGDVSGDVWENEAALWEEYDDNIAYGDE
jgi:hypothetical protein